MTLRVQALEFASQTGADDDGNRIFVNLGLTSWPVESFPARVELPVVVILDDGDQPFGNLTYGVDIRLTVVAPEWEDTASAVVFEGGWTGPWLTDPIVDRPNPCVVSNRVNLGAPVPGLYIVHVKAIDEAGRSDEAWRSLLIGELLTPR